MWQPLGWVGAILTCWCVYFFRDPARTTPLDADLVVSPADGIVSSVGFFAPPPELGLGPEKMQRISVFMSVFDCHVNRMPVAGRIAKVAYRPGLFVNADLDKASEDNERNALAIETPRGALRRGADRRSSGAADRLLQQAGRHIGRRRALRLDPLRLARRRVLPPRRAADGGGRLEGGRRRDGAGGLRLGVGRAIVSCGMTDATRAAKAVLAIVDDVEVSSARGPTRRRTAARAASKGRCLL